MEIELLDAGKTKSALKRLILHHQEIQIAVAWGYNGKLADLLMKNRKNFQSITIGLNGFATSPDLLDRLVDVPNTYIAKANEGIFHPKIYLFRSGSTLEAIVGSANFTNGGLKRNHEACLLISGSAFDEIFKQIQQELSGYDVLKQRVTSVLSDSYRRQHDAARKKQGQPDPILPNDKQSGIGLTSLLARMSWTEFSTKANLDPHHNFERRMKLLREIQRLFASVETFSELSTSEWKGVAGTLGDAEKRTAGLEHHDWGWFGSMGGNGDFSSLILKKNHGIGAALDCIPRKDPVTFEKFEEYYRRFEKAFVDAGSHHIGKYPTATRLLAMKRPDTFVCVNGKNIGGLAKALDFAPTTLTMSNYWERVIIPIQSSPWYNAVRSTGEGSELWDYRVAMLDTLYYDEHA